MNARRTLGDSRACSDGVYYVVNGILALDDGSPTFELAGRDIWTD